MPQDEGRRRKHYAHLVVGLVGHPSRQPADGLHLLHLAEMLLDSAPVGYVVKGAPPRRRSSRWDPDRRRVHAEEDAIAIRPDDLDLLAAHDFTLSKARASGHSAGV